MAAGEVRIVMDPAFEAAFLRSSDARAFLEPLTEEARGRAEQHAARRKGFLIEGISADVVLGELGFVGRVTAHDFKSIWLEYGTRRTRAQPFLIPALMETLPGAKITRR